MTSQRHETRIIKLCEQALKAEWQELESVFQELRAALHEHNELLRKQEADKLRRPPPPGTGRRGKHHDLMEGIMRGLKTVKEGSALVIPLSKVHGVKLANLRSAVYRAATDDGVNIQTKADKKNLYVWVDRRPS